MSNARVHLSWTLATCDVGGTTDEHHSALTLNAVRYLPALSHPCLRRQFAVSAGSPIVVHATAALLGNIKPRSSSSGSLLFHKFVDSIRFPSSPTVLQKRGVVSRLPCRDRAKELTRTVVEHLSRISSRLLSPFYPENMSREPVARNQFATMSKTASTLSNDADVVAEKLLSMHTLSKCYKGRTTTCSPLRHVGRLWPHHDRRGGCRRLRGPRQRPRL